MLELLRLPETQLSTTTRTVLAAAGYDLRAAHVAVIRELSAVRDPVWGLRQSEFGQRLGIAKQTVAEVVQELEVLGLVERLQHPDHGVVKWVRLTRRGSALTKKLMRALLSVQRRWERSLGQRKTKALRALLEALSAAITIEARPGSVVPQKQAGRDSL